VRSKLKRAARATSAATPAARAARDASDALRAARRRVDAALVAMAARDEAAASVLVGVRSSCSCDNKKPYWAALELGK
jgi:exopolyphosphatase/pppGpp-phosphohydrolase